MKELEEDIRRSNARKNELSRSMDEVAAEEYAELLEEKVQTYEKTRKHTGTGSTFLRFFRN